jgi:hypothetical protein
MFLPSRKDDRNRTLRPKDLSQARPAHHNDNNKQTAKSATEDEKTNMRAACSCPFLLPEKVFDTARGHFHIEKPLGTH